MSDIVSRSLLVTIILGGLAIAGAERADAEIVVVEKVSHYEVTGANGLDLGRAMLKGGAEAINLRRAVAATATKFDFVDPVIDIENGRCVVKDITVRLTIEYQFPRWNGRARASAGVRRAWDAFNAELVRHEKTHGQIARDFARRIEKELLRLSGTVMFGCQDFGTLSNLRFAALANQLRQKQLAFDRQEERSTSKISRLQLVLLKAK